MPGKLKRYLYNQYLCVRIFRDSLKKYQTSSTKSPWRRYWEAQVWLHSQGEFCSMYNAWGLNAKGKNPADYISRKEFLKVKGDAEKILIRRNQLGDLNYDVLTKDKFVAGSYLLANSVSCVSHHGVVVRGDYLPRENGEKRLESLLEQEKELFIKNVALEAGEGVLHCLISDGKLFVNSKQMSPEALQDRLSDGVWIVQSRIQAHEQIRKVNASALNTLRIVTIIDAEEPRYLGGYQAFATGNAQTDSWDKGSIYVGIDVENECTKEFGYHNLSEAKNSIAVKHPDSGVVFQGYHIPFLRDAVQLCFKAHRLFYSNFIIGWDVAITDAGPVIVEANEKPGMNVVQCVDGGLNKKILASYNKLKSGS